MHGSDEVQSILQRAIRSSSADHTEALYTGGDTRLTRFANNYVHQNVSERNATLTIRTVADGRVGSATTNEMSGESIKRTTQTATNAALAQNHPPDFAGFPSGSEPTTVSLYDEAVASLTAGERAAGAAVICRSAEDAGFVAAGVYSNTETEMGLANSNGVRLYHRWTQMEVNAVFQGDSGSGYAGQISPWYADTDVASVARDALHRAQMAQNPQEIEPGSYEVVLDTYAVHDLANFLALLSFGARAVQEGRSFMAGNLGRHVMSPDISIWDDGTDPQGFAMPFDYEGTPKQRVELITDGVARGVVYDRATARTDHTESTGHALPLGMTQGPVPLNLFIKGGDKSRDELIASVERGVLVTRFWYTRTVHPLSVIVTGMTRDGTYLIENGRITRPIRNLRFTTSYLDALNDVRGIGRDTALGRGSIGSTRAPALHLGSFNFTGTTEF